MFALALVTFLGLSSVANAETSLLAYDDFVGTTFWLISMGTLAATVFFFFERESAPSGYRTRQNLRAGFQYIRWRRPAYRSRRYDSPSDIHKRSRSRAGRWGRSRYP